MAFNFKHQAHVTPNPLGTDLTGQTILITGSNQGIGLECARQLLIFKASTVILAVRSLPKGEAARTLLLSDPTIKALTRRPEIRIMELDMLDYKNVVRFARKVKEEVKRLDAVLLNAGIGLLNYELAPTGHEKVVQVNYLSNALVALELVSLLEATARETGVPSRLSFVGSRRHEESSFAKTRPLKAGQSVLERMDNKAEYSGMTVYGDTKLLVAMFVRELAERVSSEKVVVNNMCPGGVNTRMSDVLPFPVRQVVNAYKSVYARKVEVGAWIVINALVVVGKESHGRFLKDKDVAAVTPFMLTTRGNEMQKELWDETIAEAKKVDGSVIDWAPL